MVLGAALLVGLALPAAQDPRLAGAVTLDGEHPFVVPVDADAWQERADHLRRRVRVAADLWPWPERTPLDARVHRVVDRGEYTVEAVSFASLPGHRVTASLYRPRGPGPFAGVLSPHGHWSDGRLGARDDEEVAAELAAGAESRAHNARFHLQARCATLARMGCVVLMHDMVGYADSRALSHGAGFGDVRAVLRGQSALGLQTWNSVRALDLLASSPGVDPDRLGVTGASGGGTQTFLLGAVDPRPAALAPAVMVSTTMQGGCACENAPHLRVGVGNVELAALAAPRPLALTGADDWTLAIEQRGLPELRELYALLDVPDRVEGRVWPRFGHNYNAHARAFVYGFLDRRLALGHDLEAHPLRAAALEERFEPVPPEELRIPAEELGPQLDVHGLRRLWTERQEARLAALRPTDAASLRRWREVQAGALEVLVPARLPARVELEGPAAGPRRPERHLLADGARVRVVEWWPAGPPRGALLHVDGQREVLGALDPFLARALEEDFLVLEVDTLLEGDAEARLPVDGARHGNYVGYTLCYNESLLAQRVRDVLVAARRARDLLPAGAPLVLLGSGWAGPGAVLAAAREPGLFQRVAVHWTWDLEDVNHLDDPRLLPGGLALGGLTGPASLLAPSELAVVGREPPELLRQVWHLAGAPEALRREVDGPSALAWLLDAPR